MFHPVLLVMSSAGRSTIDSRMNQGALRLSCLGGLRKLRTATHLRHISKSQLLDGNWYHLCKRG